MRKFTQKKICLGGGQGGCERRIEKNFGGGGGGGLGRVDVNKELKKKFGGGGGGEEVRWGGGWVGGAGQGGCERNVGGRG